MAFTSSRVSTWARSRIPKTASSSSKSSRRLTASTTTWFGIAVASRWDFAGREDSTQVESGVQNLEGDYDTL
eukprot:1619771-Pyramimonas_sp.AAC.1